MLQLKIIRFPQNSYIVVEGRPSEDTFYIIQTGHIRCYKASGSGIAPVVYGPGDFVGVVPCMSGHLQIEIRNRTRIIPNRKRAKIKRKIRTCIKKL